MSDNSTSATTNDATTDTTSTTSGGTAVVTTWTGIWVTWITSFVQGIIFYSFFLYQRDIELNKKKSYALYEPRQYHYGHKSPAPATGAKYHHRWWYEAYLVPDDELLRCVGLDTFMYLRMLRMGVRVCFVGTILAIFLIPIYATDSDKGPNTQKFNRITLARVDNSSPRLWATLIGWFIFIDFILLELRYEWRSTYRKHRQNFMVNTTTNLASHSSTTNEDLSDEDRLQQQTMDIVQRTVRIEGIPKHLQDETSLRTYLEHIYPRQIQSVLTSYNLPNLEKLVQERQKAILKLESAQAYSHAYPEKPKKQHKKQDAITYWDSEIQRLNDEIDTIRQSIVLTAQQQQNRTNPISKEQSNDPNDAETKHFKVNRDRNRKRGTTEIGGNDDDGIVSQSVEVVLDDSNIQRRKREAELKLASKSSKEITEPNDDSKNQQSSIEASTVGNTNGIMSSTAFVTFKTMQYKSIAMQCDLNGDPSSMIVVSALYPQSIVWENVAFPLQQQKIRKIQAAAFLLLGVCFWAIPVFFVTSVANLNSILEAIGIQSANPNKFWYGLVSGLLPVIALAVLMIVLYMTIVLLASKFIKLKSYAEIETYTLYWHQLFQFANLWLLLMGGSLFNQIDLLIGGGSLIDIVTIIATALPGASTFFVNMIIVSSLGAFALELSMLPTYGIKLILQLIQPEALRTQRQLDAEKIPPSITWGKQIPPIIFIFLVSIMYMPIVPVIEVFALVYFSGMYIVWKHQCLHVTAQPDDIESGGVTTFQQVYSFLIVCLYMSEVVFVAYMSIKAAAAQAILGCIPIVITVLVNAELQANVIKPLQQIPLELAKEEDDKQLVNGILSPRTSTTTMNNLYRQPVLDVSKEERSPMPYRRNPDDEAVENGEQSATRSSLPSTEQQRQQSVVTRTAFAEDDTNVEYDSPEKSPGNCLNVLQMKMSTSSPQSHQNYQGINSDDEM